MFIRRVFGQALTLRISVTAYALTVFSAISLAPVWAQPAADKPHHLRQLEQQHISGDWVLQCDSWVACRILGAAESKENPAEIRPVVIIDRSWKKDAPYRVQFAFIDGYGQIPDVSVHDRWRIVWDGAQADQFVFALHDRNNLKAHPAPPEATDGLVERLRRRDRVILDDGAGALMRMPSGDLDSLLGRMDRLQRPKADPLSGAQRSTWLKQYRFIVKRGHPATDATVPDTVKLACDTRTSARHIDGWRLDSEHQFWIAHCPEGSNMFLHKIPGEPISFNLRRFSGDLQLDVYSRFDPDTSILTVKLSEKGRGDCGHRVRFGWTDAQNFGMIEHRRLVLCRHIPADFWPLTWTPTSWRYADAPPASTGDATPPREEVDSPKPAN